ncbi:SDR family NAD(P)-dependent oxidoreductase [Streptomyces sp. QHH-9511]|uniref:SDR family oxidoreductase n=1 Tax=Streptomyces sp. QHH-9511 TaxID=2684468 RepID=UPI0013179557|nr:SDR family oxidoreductase [Streptomyces sp. QHH-9511]QGZ48611.1 SDR family NAD(P)-dependent oxidoreductase [Streptomyces sp. QHH-9511]
MTTESKPLGGRIALVAGATRGAGRAIAVQLGTAGATVYVTGRTTRTKVSEVGRTTETIEETAELVTAAGGEGIAVPTDHLEVAQVRALVERIDEERGRLDILVNDIWGGEHLLVPAFGKKIWETDLDSGLRMLELGVKTHVITSSVALPLLVRHPGGLVVEVTDGTAEYNTRFRENFFYDLAKNAPIRMAYALAHDLKEAGGTAVAVTPGWLRSEQMLDHFGVTEANWRDATEKLPDFAVAESPVYIGRAVAALAADPERARWNGQSLSSGQLAKEYGFTDADGSRPDAWGFIIASETGKPDVADYR